MNEMTLHHFIKISWVCAINASHMNVFRYPRIYEQSTVQSARRIQSSPGYSFHSVVFLTSCKCMCSDMYMFRFRTNKRICTWPFHHPRPTSGPSCHLLNSSASSLCPCCESVAFPPIGNILLGRLGRLGRLSYDLARRRRFGIRA
jgi:hypothetical protein